MVEKDDGPYWSTAEIWTLESNGRPVGFRAFVTFLVDPMDDKIWSVAASLRPLDDQHRPAFAHLCLGHGWGEQLPDFVARLDQERARGRLDDD